MQFTPKLFSILKEGYTLSTCRKDLIAGLTVAIVSLPLAMALAIASGASPDKGLVTAIIAGFLVSLLGGSRVQISGPTGAFVVIVFNGIAHYGYDGLLLATLMAGFILLAAGYLRFGRIINFFPHSVITGFTAGIAVIIASSQIKDFFGLQIATLPADFIPKWGSYFSHIHSTSVPTLLIGLSSLALIILMRHFTPKVPGYLVVVVLASLAVTFFNIPTETISSRFADIPSGLPLPAFPEIDFDKMQDVVPLAFTIAFLAGIESLLSAVVADSMSGFKHRPNQELVACGIANIASTLFGGLPATGAIARTATNVKAGATTPVAGLFNAVFILLFVLFATKLMGFVPMAALAAILFIVAWGMSEVHQFIHIFRLSNTDRLLLLMTFFLTILVDLTVAISLGIIMASLLFMRQMSKSVAIAPLGADETTENNAEITEENQRLILPPEVEVFQINGPLFFAVAGDLIDSLRPIGEMPKVLIIRMPMVPYLDGTGASALKNLLKDCHKKGIRVVLSGLQEQPKAILANAGIRSDESGVFFADNYVEAVTITRDICRKN